LKHIRTLSQTPATATAPTVGSLFTLIAGIVQVLATAILAKENQPAPTWPNIPTTPET
jgi:hypothetical protein